MFEAVQLDTGNGYNNWNWFWFLIFHGALPPALCQTINYNI